MQRQVPAVWTLGVGPRYGPTWPFGYSTRETIARLGMFGTAWGWISRGMGPYGELSYIDPVPTPSQLDMEGRAASLGR